MAYAETRRRVVEMLPKGGIGAEIGVWQGDFSALILAVARPQRLHLIDPWQASDDPVHARAWYGTPRGTDMEAVFRGVRTRFRDQIATGQVALHRAASASAMAALPDAGLDFVYVDGDHAYPSVRADLDLAVAKTRVGGLICVDDHRLGKWWGDGIVRAVNEVLGAHPRGLMVVFAAESQVVIVKR